MPALPILGTPQSPLIGDCSPMQKHTGAGRLCRPSLSSRPVWRLFSKRPARLKFVCLTSPRRRGMPCPASDPHWRNMIGAWRGPCPDRRPSTPRPPAPLNYRSQLLPAALSVVSPLVKLNAGRPFAKACPPVSNFLLPTWVGPVGYDDPAPEPQRHAVSSSIYSTPGPVFAQCDPHAWARNCAPRA